MHVDFTARIQAMRKTVAITFCLLLSACQGMPDRISAVDDFDAERYLGQWYEIARLDNHFERGLEKIDAHYSRRDDGGIRVLNRGYDAKRGEWKEAEGRAYFVGSPNVGRLKVTFFWPFYGAYNLIALDKENYRWAMVCGPDRNWLWILARSPAMDRVTLDSLLDRAKSQGFATDRLIFVNHGPISALR